MERRRWHRARSQRTFPVATQAVACSCHTTPLEWFGVALFLALLGFCLLLATRMERAIPTGETWE